MRDQGYVIHSLFEFGLVKGFPRAHIQRCVPHLHNTLNCSRIRYIPKTGQVLCQLFNFFIYCHITCFLLLRLLLFPISSVDKLGLFCLQAFHDPRPVGGPVFGGFHFSCVLLMELLCRL